MMRRSPLATGSDAVVRVIASLVASLALIASGSASLAQDPEEPLPTPVDTVSVIRGWPGARPSHNPPGLYSWLEGGRGWMHKLPGNVEITFDTLDEPFDTIALAGAGDNLGGPYPASPKRVADLRVQVWRLDVNGSRVIVIVKSFPDTPPALVAEAETVVESIRFEPADTGPGYRLVFELPAWGWDSG